MDKQRYLRLVELSKKIQEKLEETIFSNPNAKSVSLDVGTVLYEDIKTIIDIYGKHNWHLTFTAGCPQRLNDVSPLEYPNVTFVIEIVEKIHD